MRRRHICFIVFTSVLTRQVAIPSSLHSQTAPSSRPIPESVRLPQILSDIRAEVQPVYEMRQLPGPLGIRPLDSTTLGKDGREIRLYAGTIVGYPATGVIISDQPGRIPRIQGRMFRYWPVNNAEFTDNFDLEALYAEGEAGRCAPPVRGKEAVVCDVRFEREPDWNLILARLDSLDAWNLPDERKVPRRNVMMIHGWRIRAETLRDTTYRLWWYDNPQLFRPPEGSNALAIMRMVMSLNDLVMPASSITFARGIYAYGRDTSDFTPCGNPSESGYAEGQLSAVSQLMGDSAWKARPSPSRNFLIEGWFHRRAAVPIERGGRKYSLRWQVDTLTKVEPATGRSCSIAKPKK
jgi:hypothetical protein